MSKSIIPVRATEEQAARLKKLAKRTGKTQAELLMDGLNSSSELNRTKSENDTLRLGMRGLYARKASRAQREIPKVGTLPAHITGAQRPLQGDARTAYDDGPAAAGGDRKYLTASEAPALEEVPNG